MSDNTYQKIAIGIPLALALNLVVQCPCDDVPSCHLGEFFTLLGVAGGLGFYFSNNSNNGSRQVP